MNNDNSVFILVPLAGAIVTWGFMYLNSCSKKFYAKMKDFEGQAKLAKTREDLTKLFAEIVVYCQKECWHQTQIGFARRTLSYIRGRLDQMPK